jgi:superfamily II DNA or RNA helicase
MWLTVGNLFTKVSQATAADVEWLRSKHSGLTYGNKAGYFTTKEDKQTRFFDVLDQHFPTGFLPTVVANAKAAGLKAEVIDARQVPGRPARVEISDAVSRLAGADWLRDYQCAAADRVLEERRGIVQVSTGGGKTEIAIALAKLVPIRWLFLVHRKTLVDQTADRYHERTGDEAGRVGDGVWAPRERFTVATFQTLATALRNKSPSARARLEKFLSQFQGVIIDECHVLPAESFWKVAMLLENCHWRVGLSATPLDREDKRSVYAIAALGPVIFKIGAQQLISEGRLAKPIIRLAKVFQEFRELDKYGLVKKWPWTKVYEEGVVKSGIRNRVLLGATLAAEKPSLVFVKDVAHGKAFTKGLQKRGVRADFVWGDASIKMRQDAVRRLERADLEVLVCSVIFQEGIDIPDLRSVVIASAGKSVIAALQRIGRGMRVVEGKDTFEVWDVEDDGNAWLKRHARARRRAYQREGYAVTAVRVIESIAPASPAKPT